MKVDPLHALRAAADPGEHLAQWGGGGVRIDGGSRDIGQKGMKNQMVFAVEQKNLALRSRQLFTKRFCELYGRKPASDDNNSYGLHSLAPMTRHVDIDFPCGMQSSST